MDFTLSPDQQALQAQARELAEGTFAAKAAEVDRTGQCAPSALDPAQIGILPAIRQGHFSICELCALDVASTVQRRDDIGGETASFFQNGIDQILGKIGKHPAPDQVLKTGDRL